MIVLLHFERIIASKGIILGKLKNSSDFHNRQFKFDLLIMLAHFTVMNSILVDDKKSSKEFKKYVAKCSSPNLVETFNDSVSDKNQLLKRHNNDLAFINNEIHILSTNQTPEFIFNHEGIFKIRGRGLYCDKPELSDQIISWIERYLNNPAKTTYVTIAFEYLNSLSTSILVSILKKLSQIIHQSKKLVVQWYYEVDDENILDRGKYISFCCDIPIEFIMTNDIESSLSNT